jgi:hypothetical protein
VIALRFTWRDLAPLIAFRALELLVVVAFTLLIVCAVANVDPTRGIGAPSCQCACTEGLRQ